MNSSCGTTRRKTRSTTPFAEMFGEVFPCQFPFTSGAPGKIRPALVLFNRGPDAIICRVTSAQRSGLLDVTLHDWQAAGLLKPSVARLDRLVTAEKAVFLRRLGLLSPLDLAAVRSAWNGAGLGYEGNSWVPGPARLRARRLPGRRAAGGRRRHRGSLNYPPWPRWPPPAARPNASG